MEIKGKILQLQNYSVNDGSGIRTTVFFAGCPLRCRWCANPEGYEEKNRILYVESRCVRCGSCAAVCPNGVSLDFKGDRDREKCSGCGACVKACLTEARKNTVTEYSTGDIIKLLERQLKIFRKSGGGVTYSGGECTLQAEFLSEITDEIYDLNIQQAMETSGYFELKEILPILERIDLLFIDIKCFDGARHHEYTGVDNERILKNIAALGKRRGSIVVRIPVIMGINGDDKNIRATAKFVKKHLSDPVMELLPYHAYGADKYKQLGLSYDENEFRTPTAREMGHLRKILRDEGVRPVSFR